MDPSKDTPFKSRPPPGQQGSTPFRSASASKFKSSLVPMTRPSPARSLEPSSKLMAASTVGRDLFRTTTPRSSRTTPFAPSLPIDATRPSPGARKFAAQKSVSGGMSNTASTELFKMRIPSPDPELTGEAISKEMPEDPKRTGTVYADQFLAHKCPSQFDDLQRRQFFCILDLRRLKYAANEIFATKDWKLNIMNFAKEYEKSRGLIMLRYGLYQFKNVKPSEEVLKKWRATHGLPEPEPEQEPPFRSGVTEESRRAAAPNFGSTKRKAEEDLAPKDNTLMASNSNQNKRRNLAPEASDPYLTGPAPFKKSKRKADDTEEPDENHPSKIQKAAASPATAGFESILNKVQNGTTPSAKRPAPSSTGQPAVFATQKTDDAQPTNFATKSNPFAPSSTAKPIFGSKGETNGGSFGGSIFAGPKIESTPAKNTGNIFSYLSESSANSSSNENGNADGEAESDSESERESETAEAAPTDQPSAATSAGTNTPPAQSGASLFAVSKPSSISNLFGGLSKPGEPSSKGGLFGRVQVGSNGQPLRATPTLEEQEKGSSGKQTATETVPSKTPAKQPGDYTFNPATTPIAFGKPSSDNSQPPPPKPDAGLVQEAPGLGPNSTAKPKSMFGAATETDSASHPSESTKSIFSGTNNTSTAPSPFSDPSSRLMPGGIEKTDASGPPAVKKQQTGIFGNPSAGINGASGTKSLFASAGKSEDSAASAIKAQTSGIFGIPSVDILSTTKESSNNQDKDQETKTTDSKPVSSAVSSGIFGASAKPTPTDSFRTTASTGLFGEDTKPTSQESDPSSSSTSLFGRNPKATPTDTFRTSPTTNLFGVGQNNATTSTSTKSVFGSSAKPSSAGFTFGASGPVSKKREIGTEPDAEAVPNAVSAKPMFATQAPKASSPAPMTLFGTQSALGEKKQEEPPTKTTSMFGSNVSSTGPIFSFGSQTSATGIKPQPSPTPSFTFGTNPPGSPAVSFGASTSQTNGTQPEQGSFQFGGSNQGAASSSFTFGQDSNSAGSSFTFTAGGQNQPINNPFSSKSNVPSSTPNFGGNKSTPTSTPGSSFNFSFGQQGPSTPKAAPASQGAPIFGGTSNGMNGAPSFSFTGATPPQNTPFGSRPTPAPAGIFGSLLPKGGDATHGANSPFPAPSSMGTTPVNGTPEPQPQNEDGEEAPQQQLTLTEGGPGEEDEVILHEVRAKAIKYVAIKKDSDEEQDKKSPWSTQGVGPLRVLKNKVSGGVRILLRAEPRGHIALNKTILSDVEYKPKDKTVHFVAASDDGSMLETWVLQLKKAEFAHQLASVLEANKSANKK